MFAKKLALALATAAIASVGVTGVAQAYEVGDTCQVNQNANGWRVYGWWGTYYYVYYPESVIIDTVGTQWLDPTVHKSGAVSGFIDEAAINQSTCG